MTDKQQSPSAGRFLALFEEGKRFTEELLKENEKLRLVITKLRDEKAELEQRLQRGEAPAVAQKAQYLEQEVAHLHTELETLRQQFNSVEVENRQFADRYVRLERQNSDLISMYVATYRLHSTLDFGEVVRTVKEIIVNLVGSEVFGIYLADEAGPRLTLIAHEGMDKTPITEIRHGDGVLGTAAATGTLWVAPPETDLKSDLGHPIAAIPLKVDQRVIGLIVIFRLLAQKEAFDAVDYELFELLGGHAATALYVANLYAVSERKRSTLEGFIGLLKPDIQQNES